MTTKTSTHPDHDGTIEWSPPIGGEATEVTYTHWKLADGPPLPDFAVGSWDNTTPAELNK